MPFKQVFERNINRNMQEGEPGPSASNDEANDADIKKLQAGNDSKHEEEDEEVSEKKDRPPRFSTLFEGGQTPALQVTERYIEPKRRSGIYLPTPLFVVLALILFFESTLLFAYTIIGLYNNVPAGLLPFGPSSVSVDSCNCEKQPGINIAPNFYLPGAQGQPTAGDSHVPQVLSSTTSTKTTSSSTTTHSVKPITKMITVTPSQKTVDKTINLTVNADGSTLAPESTTTSTEKSKASSKANKRASISNALESINAALTPDPVPSTLATSTLKPKPTKKAEKDKDANKVKQTTASSSATGMPCFGGSGAAQLDCPGRI